MDQASIVREYFAGGNRVMPYFFGRTLADAPMCLIFLISSIIPYWLAGLRADAGAFAYYCLASGLLIFGAQSLGYLASSVSSNPNVCLAFCTSNHIGGGIL